MTKDISLIFEAYRKIHEAAGETGAVIAPAAGQASTQPTQQQGQPGTAATATTKFELSLTDAKKILDNISDTYIKARETALILKKNNVPNVTQYLQAERDKLLPFIANVVNATSATGEDTKKLLNGLDPEISTVVQRAFTQHAWSGKASGGTPDNKVTPAEPSSIPPKATSSAVPIENKPGGAGVAAAVPDTTNPQDSRTLTNPTAQAPVAADTVAPAASTQGNETIAQATPATGEEPVQRATAQQEGPYYIMTTKGPRLATKNTPGAYQINRPATNK